MKPFCLKSSRSVQEIVSDVPIIEGIDQSE